MSTNKHQKSWSLSEKQAIVSYYQLHGLTKTMREYNVSHSSIYNWQESQSKTTKKRKLKQKAKVSAKEKELIQLRSENASLKAIVAEKELQIRIQNELLKKNL